MQQETRNRSLQACHSGASPVIGVILMVAITVVLATVVFFLVNTEESEPTPSLMFQRNEDSDELRLIRGAKGDWGDMRLFSPAGGTGLRYALNGEVSSASPEVGAGVQMPAGALNGGDVVSFCMDGGGDDVPLTLTHLKSNTVMYRGEFLTLRPCA